MNKYNVGAKVLITNPFRTRDYNKGDVLEIIANTKDGGWHKYVRTKKSGLYSGENADRKIQQPFSSISVKEGIIVRGTNRDKEYAVGARIKINNATRQDIYENGDTLEIIANYEGEPSVKYVRTRTNGAFDDSHADRKIQQPFTLVCTGEGSLQKKEIVMMYERR